MFIVRGVTREGKEVFYTGRAGEGFVSDDKAQAFDGYGIEGARNRAKSLNQMTAIHGIHFIAMGEGND